MTIVLTMPMHLKVQDSKYSSFSPSDIPSYLQTLLQEFIAALSSLGENRLLSVEDTIQNLNVKPM